MLKYTKIIKMRYCALFWERGRSYRMIVALEEAKRKLVDLHEVIEELGNQLRIEEARERVADLERETLVQDFWNDA